MERGLTKVGRFRPPLTQGRNQATKQPQRLITWPNSKNPVHGSHEWANRNGNLRSDVLD